MLSSNLIAGLSQVKPDLTTKVEGDVIIASSLNPQRFARSLITAVSLIPS